MENIETYRCSACGYQYEVAKGDPDQGIAPGTPWEEISEFYQCPLCGVYKDCFDKID